MRRFGLDEDDAMDKVLYIRAYTSEEQINIVGRYLSVKDHHHNSMFAYWAHPFLPDVAAALMFENPGEFRVLIMDSIMALFRAEYSGRGELSERQQRLSHLLSKLQKISEEYNVAVFLTNQVTADPGNSMSTWPKPIGGNILAHAATTRIFCRKGKGENRVAKVVDSPDMPEEEATYKITEAGICDGDDWTNQVDSLSTTWLAIDTCIVLQGPNGFLRRIIT